MARVERQCEAEEIESGKITISCVIARYLEEQSIAIDGYLGLVQEGRLDRNGDGTRFNSTPDSLKEFRADDDSLPDDLPCMRGAITWRRATQMWSFDIGYAALAPGINWHEQLPKGTGEARIDIQGSEVPATLAASMIGQPLRSFLDADLLNSSDIIVRRVDHFKSIKANGKNHQAQTQIYLDLPRITLDTYPMKDI